MYCSLTLRLASDQTIVLELSAALNDNVKPEEKRIDNIDRMSIKSYYKNARELAGMSGHCTDYRKDCDSGE